MNTLRQHREALAKQEYNSYDPEHFPGSRAWLANKKAANDLKAFDLAHPEVVASINAERIERQKAEYKGLSDFAKQGS